MALGPLVLGDEQIDAIAEIVNIGFGRAAASLSVLVGVHIGLQAPSVEIYPISKLPQVLDDFVPRRAIIIHQVFCGSICGDLILFMDIDSASILVDLLSGGPGVAKHLTPSDREALIEVGNILLNGYIGSFGNLLKLSISFELPHIHEESLVTRLEKISETSDEEPQFVVLVRTDFNISNAKASGYVALLLGVRSLQILIQTLEQGL